MLRCSSFAIFQRAFESGGSDTDTSSQRGAIAFNRKTAGDGAQVLVVEAEAVSRKRSPPRAIAQRYACWLSTGHVIVKSQFAKSCSFARIVEIGGKRTRTHTESSPELEFPENKAVMWVLARGVHSGWSR